MKINSVNSQNFNGGVLSGEFRLLKNGAVALGVPVDVATRKLNQIAGLFKRSDYDVFITKPRDSMDISGCVGAIIVANKNSVCKGMYIHPSSCTDKLLLDKYLAAAKKLAQEDYSLKKNTVNSMDWIV